MTRNPKVLPDEELERLSAYLDSRLPEDEAARLESRLKQDRDLARALDELRITIRLLRSLPQVRVPRNFTLTPEAAGKTTRSWQYPVLQLGTAVATLAFLVVTGFGFLLMSGRMAGAPAMAPAADVAEFAAPAEEQPMLEEARQAALPTEAAAAEAPPPGAQYLSAAPPSPISIPAAGAETPAPACAECAGLAATATTHLPLEEGIQTTSLPAPAPSPCTDCETASATAAAEAMGDQALKAVAATTTPTMAEVLATEAEAPPRSPVSLWVVLEIALGTAAVSLAILTLRMRRRN